jgi:hypothetical protein
MFSAFTSILKVKGSEETAIPEEEIEQLVARLRDPLGTLYRFTLPKSSLKRVVREQK